MFSVSREAAQYSSMDRKSSAVQDTAARKQSTFDRRQSGADRRQSYAPYLNAFRDELPAVRMFRNVADSFIKFLLSHSAARDSETAASRIGAVHLFVCLSVCLSPKCKKTRFSQKLSNSELRCLLTTYRKLCKLNWAFQRTHYWIPKIRHLENRHNVIFFCRRWSDLNKISQTVTE